MPHDPVLIAETRSWLQRAKADIRAVEVDMLARPPLLMDAVFHCQQAAEKSLKGFLVWRSVSFRKVHSLEEIGEQCIDQDPTLVEIIERAVPLTDYVWKYRYPGEPAEPSESETSEAFEVAKEVFEAVSARIPLEARP